VTAGLLNHFQTGLCSERTDLFESDIIFSKKDKKEEICCKIL